MGLIADFIVATPDEAARYPVDGLERLQATSLTSLEIEVLWALLIGEPWSAGRHMLEEVESDGDEGPWLMRFPAPLVDKLAALSPAAVDLGAATWAATDEMRGSTTEVTAYLIRELQVLARSVQRQAPSRALFLYNCL